MAQGRLSGAGLNLQGDENGSVQGRLERVHQSHASALGREVHQPSDGRLKFF